jgi:hypothetical protein
MSATWCAWIEQGREVQASPQALSRLARALGLTRAERAYLFELSGRRDPEAAAPGPTAEAPASLQAVVDLLDCPAYGLDRLWNACCWNEAAGHLFPGWLDGPQRNLLRFVFLDPAARRLIPEWEDRARRVLAEFRADYGHSVKDPDARAMLDALCRESVLFRKAWDEQGVLEREGGLRMFSHPRDGLLCFRQHTFSPSERPDHKLVVLRPVTSD